MKKAEKTRQYIIEKTADHFNRKGYKATSLAEITEMTGLTKGGIYGNFSNKEELVLEAYRYNSRQLATQVSKLLTEIGASCLDRLKAFTGFYRANWPGIFENGGCPLMNAGVEADDTFPLLKEQVKESFESLIGKVTRVIEEGQSTGEFRREPDGKSYASLFVILIEGGVLLAKTTNEIRYLNEALDRVLYIINSEIAIPPEPYRRGS